MKILHFLFGKIPNIFRENKHGQVLHHLKTKKWDLWERRFKSPDYNWRKHSGTDIKNIKK